MKRVDNNHGEIVQALRKVGATVQSLASIGHGCPDLLVGYRDMIYIMEIKSEGGTLTEQEIKWGKEWNGSSLWVVRSSEQAIDIVTGKEFINVVS